MNTQIESSLRVIVSSLLAAVLTSIVVVGIGNGSGSTTARATLFGAQSAHQAATAEDGLALQTDEPSRAG